MHESLRALLRDVLDYAGLFPPASLDLDAAIRTYADGRAMPEAWILARFVCPAKKLADLSPYRDLFAGGAPYRFSVLGEASATLRAFAGQLATLRLAMETCQQEHGRAVSLEAIETRVPDELALESVTGERAARLGAIVLAEYERAFSGGEFSNGPLFLEVPPGPGWQAGASGMIAAIAAWNSCRRGAGCGPVGFKLRTGGVTANAIPEIEQLAWTVVGCRDAGVPLKFTAGLHHPIRTHRAEVQSKMHGFVNVFVAAALAHAYPVDPLGEREIGAILACEDPRQFEFRDEGLEIGQRTASLEVIERVRQCGAVSFGSCSFADPVQDLRELGWL